MSDNDRVTTRVGAKAPRPSSSQLVQGDVVDGRYRLERYLSRGGMGQVWQATDLDLQRAVAIKLMHPGLVTTDSARTRFLREAQAAATLDHPNVVKIIDVKIDGDLGVPFLTMELLRGEDLASRLSRGPLGYVKTLELMRDVCSAIAKAHAQRSVHRDIKPANIFLVSAEDRVVAKLLDFGIVKSLRPQAELGDDLDLTTAGAALGTVSYMSPEQANDAQQVDHRADLWSLAVVIFECLTGKRAFRAKSRVDLVTEVYEDRIVPSNYSDNLPRGFDSWFARATHRDIERRVSSVAQLLSSFAELAEGTDPGASDKDAELLPPPSHSWASDANQIDINELRALTFKNKIVTGFLDSATKHFVVGSKGLGKTLLLTYKRSLLYEHYQGGEGRKQAAVAFIPEGRPYLDLMSDLPTPGKAATDLMSDLANCKRMWRFGFRVAAISHQGGGASSDESEELAVFPAQIRKMLQGRKAEPSVVVRELLAQPRSKLEQLLDRTESFLEYKIRSLHHAIFMFVDKLDQALRQLPRDAWVHMQAGMVEAAWDLMNTNAHVKIYATIREEAFAEYESDIKANLHGATTALRYSKRDLKDMLEKLTYFYERVRLRDFVNVDIVSADGGARAEPPFEFIYRHTLGRPRDFVIIASEISHNRGELDQQLFARVVRDTSAGLLVANVFNEMRVFLDVLRSSDARGRFLALVPHDVLTEDELIAVWCEFHGFSREYYELHGHNAEGVYHPFRELWDCGLLGVIERDPNSSRRRLRQRFRRSRDPIIGSRRKLPNSPHYLIHPALQALVTQLAGGGDFVPYRHVIIGHGEPWPSYYPRLIEIQRELLRGAKRDDADTEDMVFDLLDLFAAHVGVGDSVDRTRRLMSATPLFERLCARLERTGWDELYVLLLELFPSEAAAARPHARTPSPSPSPLGPVPLAKLAPGPPPARPRGQLGSTAGAAESGVTDGPDTTLGPTRLAIAAMLLVDLVNSTGFVKDHGDAKLVEVLREFRRLLKREGGEPPLIMKGTGDGYLVVYEAEPPALDAALAGAAALRRGIPDPTTLRMVIHLGEVLVSADDVHGVEATRLFRLEKVSEAGRVGAAGELRLPISGRVLLSAAAYEALSPGVRANFEVIGRFEIGGFEEPIEVWVEREETLERRPV